MPVSCLLPDSTPHHLISSDCLSRAHPISCFSPVIIRAGPPAPPKFRFSYANQLWVLWEFLHHVGHLVPDLHSYIVPPLEIGWPVETNLRAVPISRTAEGWRCAVMPERWVNIVAEANKRAETLSDIQPLIAAMIQREAREHGAFKGMETRPLHSSLGDVCFGLPQEAVPVSTLECDGSRVSGLRSPLWVKSAPLCRPNATASDQITADMGFALAALDAILPNQLCTSELFNNLSTRPYRGF